MIKSIYTAVTNAENVPCGKKGQLVKSEPIPLLRDKYLGEYRTELEKAKVRKNLGIADDSNLQWGNLTGQLEKQQDLIKYVDTIKSYSTPLYENISTVKEALDYALVFISSYQANNESIEELQNLVNELKQNLEDSNSTIEQLNSQITTINEKIVNIDVDRNIQTWIENHLSSSIQLNDTLEVNISQKENNAIVDEDGLYVADLTDTVTELSNNVKNNTDNITTIQESLVYNSELPEDTVAPTTVGGIEEGTTLEQLKGKSLTNIIDIILFPTYVRDLIKPTLSYNPEYQLVEVNSEVIKPELTFEQGDAGEELTRDENSFDSYSDIAKYKYIAKVTYAEGNYLINNKGEQTDKKIEAGEVTATSIVETTYPWYAGNINGVIKQDLVPFDTTTEEIDVYLSGQAIIKLPGKNSQLQTFTVNGGLGYLNVDLTGWDESTEYINGFPYKVWTKQDEYSSVLPHRIKFILNK